jgi:hypothetical protein
MLLDWTEEKLRLLEQEQLLNLLANLDHQRSIGRVGAAAAEALDTRITALLSASNGRKRRNELKKAQARVAGSEQAR